jgi:hypothetical protein
VHQNAVGFYDRIGEADLGGGLLKTEIDERGAPGKTSFCRIERLCHKGRYHLRFSKSGMINCC